MVSLQPSRCSILEAIVLRVKRLSGLPLSCKSERRAGISLFSANSREDRSGERMMKQDKGLQQWSRFLVAHKLVSCVALTLIVFSSFAGSLLVSRIFSARADTTNSVPPPAAGVWDLNGSATIDQSGNLQLTPPT